MSQQGDLDGQMRAYHCLGTVYKAMKDHRKTQECFEQVCLIHYTTYIQLYTMYIYIYITYVPWERATLLVQATTGMCFASCLDHKGYFGLM